VGALDDLRSAERAFLDTGDKRHLDGAAALVEGDFREAPYAHATRLWLSLLSYDHAGDNRHLDAAVDACRMGDWRDPGLADVAVAVLLRRWARDGDGADLDRAIDLGRRSASASGRDVPLWLTPAWRAIDLAYAYLERYRLRDTEDDLRDARNILRGAVRITKEPTIRALGLRHLASCEQELYLRHGTRRLLDQAIRRYQRALAMVAVHSVVRPMLLTELGAALQDRFAEDEDPADIDRAVALAEEAAAADASRPDSACHLVNLGTALNTRYEQTGDPDDLDEALRRWSQSLDLLPPASAYRPAFLDRLALGFNTRWEHENGKEEDLNAAIDYSRVAFREGAATPNAAVYACHLADALESRWELHRDPDDLHEAVSVFTAAVDSHEQDGARAADLAANLAHILLARYQALGGLDDVDAALAALGRLPAGLGRSQRATVAASTARALSMRYQATGERDDLAAAIATARRGLTDVDAMSTTRNSRAARLAHLLFLRYLRSGRRRDLCGAIRLLQGVVDEAETGDGREPSPDQLSQLSSYLAERYDRDGDLAHRDAAIRLSRWAHESDRRDGEPSLDTTLASLLHGRFTTEGWLDELDEAVDRHRKAVERQIPATPSYPAILNNLGIALQDSYVYMGDDAALDEAIGLHERAIACCPPGSPDRPGYLGTLAAAVQLRFERDKRVIDLDRVIDLGEQALAALGSDAPERAKLLSNLSAARHLHARITGDSADFERAVETFRAALRRIGRNSPARAIVLRGYADMLADRFALFPTRHGRAEVLRAFQGAVAASEDAPVVRLGVASALGEWALRLRLWPQAAEAYHAAAEARHALFGAQISRAYRETWLTREEDIAVAEAFAWVHCQKPRRAATALDGGRALGLAEALDARILADRLRTGNHWELAHRYEQATERLARAADARRVGRAAGSGASSPVSP
jgi:tetratricopeptide (TPR) repeat protein